jgi:ABC-2 type transport system ATP-binding protein
VDLTVEQGTVHGLLGPNGAGKTTTIKMLLGLVRADGGEFEIAGADPRRASGRSHVGFLPEQPYFPGHLRAEKGLVRYGRLANGGDELPERAASLLEQVGLAPHADVQLSKFSRGMLQRFGIAQALVGGPEVVVLDEPASGLDPVGQRDVRNIILSLKDAGMTVLLSSHQLSEVEAVCDRVTIMNAGRVAAEGRLDELLNAEGLTSVRIANAAGGLPPEVSEAARDIAVSGETSVFSVPDASVRSVVDRLDDAGIRIVSITPKRDSLEDYFDRMLRTAGDEGGGETS